MIYSGDNGVWASHAIVSNCYCSHIQNLHIVVGQKILPNPEIFPCITVKRRLHVDLLAANIKKLLNVLLLQFQIGGVDSIELFA